MLFRSAVHDDHKSSQDLIVLCHAEERVLIPLPKSYEDAQSRAMDVFQLEGNIVFETNELPGLAGLPVRIHGTAWEGISPVLSCVTVQVVAAEASVAISAEAVGNSTHHISTQKRVGGSTTRPIRGPSLASNSNGSEPHYTARNIPPAASSSRVVAPTVTPPNIGGSSMSRGKTVQSTPKTSLPLNNLKALSNASGSTKPPAPAKPPPYAQTPEPHSDEEEEEEATRIISPTKKRVTRPRILSDQEDEPEDTISARRSDAAEEEEESDELEDAEYISAAPPVAKTPSSSHSIQGPALSTVKLPASSRSGSRPLVQLDPLPSTKRPLDSGSSPKVKLEKALSKPVTPLSQETAPSQSQGKSDESFVIMIEYNEDPESRSLFKTRGRHMVSKVLMQACRTFGIEDYYDSARLVLLFEIEDGGETVVYRSVCNNDETMAQSGAERDARFVVEIVDGDDNACESFLCLTTRA
ncbi:hypothetical protein BC628DRAFT_1317873 [Trametes gibbosa]|nr:hypothetical protein BC628DRAFT_1317873 [Trametes gibbosa]